MLYISTGQLPLQHQIAYKVASSARFKHKLATAVDVVRRPINAGTVAEMEFR